LRQLQWKSFRLPGLGAVPGGGRHRLECFVIERIATPSRPGMTLRRAPALVVLAMTLTVSGGVVAADRPPRPLTHEDVRWLNRVTFGIDSGVVARYRELGRERFLDEQLHPPAADPPELAADLASLPIAGRSAADLIKSARAEQQRITTLPEADQKQKARMALNQQRREMVEQTARRQLARALYSPSQLREQMTWFWINHFNVFGGKAQVALAVPDYENTSVRPHALGSFRDLVLATLDAPAMLMYLDNAQSAAGRINENYARELMELHTLGVSGGPSGSRYSQQDVQELARVLTGVGLFEFNPRRHDFGAKTVLGHRIDGNGFKEVEQVVTMLCRQPATARFVSTKLATYFAADDPPAKLVDAMATTFMKTDGDIAAVLKTMFLSREFAVLLNTSEPTAGKFKDPVQFVVSSLRLAYDGKMISNYRPVLNWLNQLGEPPFGHVTPDGYPLVESAWASSGQMVKRFEIARIIGSGNAPLFTAEDGTRGPRTGFPMLTNRLFYDAIEPTLSARTRAALSQASSQQEWNTVLLSSPDWMMR
jgi:uncharacterized protein (DUF1800 family)